MNELKIVTELMKIAILSAVVGMTVVAVFVPDHFGYWLQRIDTARFELIDCDCTESLDSEGL
jgi:hypothetical protein